MIIPTHPTQIADIMTQQRNHEVQPIAWRDRPFTQVLAFEDFLAHQGDHDGVLDVMV